MSDAYANFSACMHGIDAADVRLYRDERHNALWVYLNDSVSIRADLKTPDDLERDQAGLLKVAEIAAQAAQVLERLAGKIGSGNAGAWLSYVRGALEDDDDV